MNEIINGAQNLSAFMAVTVSLLMIYTTWMELNK